MAGNEHTDATVESDRRFAWVDGSLVTLCLAITEDPLREVFGISATVEPGERGPRITSHRVVHDDQSNPVR